MILSTMLETRVSGCECVSRVAWTSYEPDFLTTTTLKHLRSMPSAQVKEHDRCGAPFSK